MVHRLDTDNLSFSAYESPSQFEVRNYTYYINSTTDTTVILDNSAVFPYTINAKNIKSVVIETAIADKNVIVSGTKASTPNSLAKSFTPETSYISVYPNPTSGLVNITAPENITTVFDLNGKLLITEKNNTIIDLGVLPLGVYMFNIATPRGLIIKKVVKQ